MSYLCIDGHVCPCCFSAFAVGVVLSAPTSRRRLAVAASLIVCALLFSCLGLCFFFVYLTDSGGYISFDFNAYGFPPAV